VTTVTGRDRPVAFVARPRSVEEALAAMDEAPWAALLAGGTDLCVEVNFGHRSPAGVVCLRRVGELGGCRADDEVVTIGALTTYTQLIEQMSQAAPALAAAARTVGSPQIRNAGTIGGNVATASPAGDTLPFLVASDAQVVLRSQAGERCVPVGELITGVKRTGLRPGEMVAALRFERTRGPQQFLKVGTRNAMVIAIASAAVIVDVERRNVRCGLGSVGPVPLRARQAEQLISDAVDWSDMTAPASAVEAFARVAADECSPITDHRSSAGYRRRAVEVVVARGMRRCLSGVH
jgi:CO/xanthine dehydrogenase FAD-binding subunit